MLCIFNTGLSFQNNQIKHTLQCPSYINDRIQYCVTPVAEYAKTLNQKVK